MVRGLLEGRKTQTRRLAKRQDIFFRNGRPWVPTGIHSEMPYTQPGWSVGDLLWVRETWRPLHSGDPSRGARYRADAGADQTLWRPAIYMPRWASRLTLEVTGVRVERLQDISRDDAIAEGLVQLPATHRYVVSLGDQYFGLASHDPREVYAAFWDSINNKPGRRWANNPWVMALTFRVHRSNIDAVLKESVAA